MTSDGAASTVENPVGDQKFDALRNAIYHAARRNFFDLTNRFLNFAVIIMGAGVATKVATLVHLPELLLEFGVVTVATAQLVFDFGYRARSHEILQMKYYEMLAEMELALEPDPRRWRAKLFTIAAGEPMPMRALDALAYNAALDATTSDPEMRRSNRIWVPRIHRLLRHFVAFHAYEYKLESEHLSLWQWLQNWRTEN